MGGSLKVIFTNACPTVILLRKDDLVRIILLYFEISCVLQVHMSLLGYFILLIQNRVNIYF